MEVLELALFCNLLPTPSMSYYHKDTPYGPHLWPDAAEAFKNARECAGMRTEEKKEAGIQKTEAITVSHKKAEQLCRFSLDSGRGQRGQLADETTKNPVGT